MITEAPGGAEAERVQNELAELAASVRSAGLRERRPSQYLARGGFHAALYLGCAVASFALSSPGLAVPLGLVMGLALGQLGILVHDAGHNQVLRGVRGNARLGQCLANLVIGASFRWWVDKHDQHHRYPNQIGLDPDLEVPLHAYFSAQLNRATAVGRFFVRHQAVLLPFVSSLEGLSVRRDSLLALARAPAGSERRVEVALLGLHYGLHLLALATAPHPLTLLLVLAVRELAMGVYLTLLFLPNHVGRPLVPALHRLGFLRHQVTTARNLRPSRLTLYLFGPLAFQIEHHLFPRVPFPRLPEVRAIVKPYCLARSIDYHETGIVDAIREALAHMHAVSSPLRVRRPR